MYPEVKNAIVLMFDSLQYNYLGCHGNTWMKTPNFDRFAREGIVFDNCYIEGVPTVPCRRAMHTGRYTLHAKGWSALDMDDTTIADMCWGTGIDSALIFDCPMYRLPKFGYSRGFDKVWFVHGHEADHAHYGKDDLIHLNPDDYFEKNIVDALMKQEPMLYHAAMHETVDYLKHRQYWKSDEDQNVAVVMKKAVQYLEERDVNKSFFMWVDNFDPHEPWDPPSVYDPEMKCPYNPDYKGKDVFNPPACEVKGIYTEDQLHHIRMLYAEKVQMCDKWLGYFMDNVKRLGLEQNTMIMLVSDHGEPLGNGEHGHGLMRKVRPWPYEELVHGIMMIKAPGVKANQRSKAFVQSCDVAPTVCDFLGIGVRDFHQGKSVLPIAYGKIEKIRDFAIAGYHKYSWSIITDDWSYIHWLKRSDNESIALTAMNIYGGTQEHSSHVDKKSLLVSDATFNEEERRHIKEATLDNEAQWTCTPSSTASVPEKDELYDRKKDMAQLHNVADKNPAVAKKLYDQLREFMGELRTS